MKQRRTPGEFDPTRGIVSVSYEKPPSEFAVNLRRLIYFHHWSAREAAKVIGVSEHAMSAWLTEKRKPGIDSVMRIAGLYDIDPRRLSGDQLEFAKQLADPDRIQHAEANIEHAARGVGTVTPLHRTGTRKAT
jgi:transcriptional regulator with XRE-family HTH domain